MVIIQSLLRSTLVIIVLLWLSNPVHSYYSEPYDKSLDDLILIDPNQAMSIAKKNLLDAELSGNSKKQLESIYYIVSALSVLSDVESQDKYIEKGLALATFENNIRFKSEFIGFKAYQSEIKGNLNIAVTSANKALSYAYETNDERLIAENLAIRAQMNLAVDNYDLALKDIEKAIDSFKLNNDKKNASLAYNLLATTYVSLDDLENAIKFYQESLAYDEIKSDYYQATVYYNIGATYSRMEKYELAVEYYKKSRELSIKTKDTYSIAYTDYGMAEMFALKKEASKAELSLTPVFEVFKFNKDLLMLFNSNMLMSEIKILKKDYTLARAYLDKAEKQSKILDTPSIHLYLIDQNITYYVAQEKWKEAYEFILKSNDVRWESQEKEKGKLISELKIRFNAQFDQEKLELLQKQNKLQENSILQEKTKQNYLLGLIGLSVVLLIFTYVAYRTQRKIKRRLYGLSVTDDLTKVANRRHIMQKLKEYQIKSREQDFSFGIIMIDLDYFKKINDTYGHEVGNEVLIYFANCAKNVMSKTGEVGRVGGEEWLILLPNINFEVIRTKLKELREAYKNTTPLKVPKDCVLSFSSGVLVNSGQYDSYEKMLYDVDMAMYKAKNKGREQDVYVSASLL
ncbi:MAG: diguanylate cyclase [Proteobacteria bacterium]|nr:diguanylate cyclase [Pseudomonadota bacterium]